MPGLHKRDSVHREGGYLVSLLSVSMHTVTHGSRCTPSTYCRRTYRICEAYFQNSWKQQDVGHSLPLCATRDIAPALGGLGAFRNVDLGLTWTARRPAPFERGTEEWTQRATELTKAAYASNKVNPHAIPMAKLKTAKPRISTSRRKRRDSTCSGDYTPRTCESAFDFEYGPLLPNSKRRMLSPC